jgi:hypothetical protein
VSERAPRLTRLTPRLLGAETAAEYCGVSVPHFLETVGKAVQPVHLRKRRLWDVRAIDRFLDVQSGLSEPLRSGSEWLGALDADPHEGD